jgi:Rrf2 family transcriptional regulator, cysteine metabolism repressor
MNISVKGEYALQAVFDLAMHQPGDPVKIADIAKRQKIPQKFLELILAALKQGGFVESRRGAEGGYLLARNPDSITVGQILQFIEGKRQTGRKHRGETPLSEMWRQVEDAVSGVVDHTSISELVRRWRDRQGKYVPNWEI